MDAGAEEGGQVASRGRACKSSRVKQASEGMLFGLAREGCGSMRRSAGRPGGRTLGTSQENGGNEEPVVAGGWE